MGDRRLLHRCRVRRKELADRGRGVNVHEKYGLTIPRDGGIADLLDEAADPDRRFDVVICESISRVARRAFEGLSVERELAKNDVTLFAANEPITVSGSRAQRILQRRINQAVAEYEVPQTLELSWGGLCTHVRDGWNIGKPPYGYRAKTFRRPNPAKAARGHTKMRLEPEPTQAETLTTNLRPRDQKWLASGAQLFHQWPCGATRSGEVLHEHQFAPVRSMNGST